MVIARGIMYVGHWCAVWMFFCSTSAAQTRNHEKDTEPTVSPSPSSGAVEPSDTYWCELLQLSDDQLFQLGVGRSIGTYCYIRVSNPDSANACEFYVQGRPNPDSSYYGIPRSSKGNLGAGCVEQDPGSACSYYDVSYSLTDDERDSMCSDSIVANAAAQLRFGIRNGYCMDDPNENCGVGSSSSGSTTDSSTTINNEDDDDEDVWSLAAAEPLVFTDGISESLTFAASADSSRLVSVSGSGMLRVYNYTSTTNTSGSWVLDLQREDSHTFGYNFVLQGSLQLQVDRTATRWIVAQPFTEQVAVYSLEHQELQTIQTFGNGYNYTSDSVVIEVVNQAAVATNSDGSRIAMTLVVSETTYAAPTWTNLQRAVRVYEYKRNVTSGGYSYEPMGELLVLDNVTAHYGSKVEMDASGDTLLVGDNKGDDWDASALFRYDPESAQWERFSSKPPPFGRLSPNGTRIASRDFQEEAIRIFQLIPQSNEWRQIAVIEAPVKSESKYLPVDFGASMDWSENGETLIVGAPGEGRRFDTSGEMESGAVYVFEQQSSCDLDPSGDPTDCTFEQVGRLPCTGAECGSRVDISSDGLTAMYLLQGENGRPTLVRYTRTPTPTKPNKTSNFSESNSSEAPTSAKATSSFMAFPTADAPTSSPSPSSSAVEPPTGSDNYWCKLLQLSDKDLFDLGVDRSIGTYCYIQVSSPGSGNACGYYVKGRPDPNSSYNGIPLTSEGGLGTGCVKQGPGSSCYFYDSRYPLTNTERESMCTDSLEANTAAQLRYGIRNGHCMDDPKEKCGGSSATQQLLEEQASFATKPQLRAAIFQSCIGLAAWMVAGF